VTGHVVAAHVLLLSQDAEADRAFLRDVLGWPSVEAGRPGSPADSWPIFAMPPAEVAVHPTVGPPATQLYLMCDDLAATVAMLAERGVRTTGAPHDQGWGIVTGILLPSGAEVGLYQPKHPTAYQLERPEQSPTAPQTP
jgi:predicted enzyme related to lactoylglutathione lyase